MYIKKRSLCRYYLLILLRIIYSVTYKHTLGYLVHCLVFVCLQTLAFSASTKTYCQTEFFKP